jgi:hypothetical protein
VAIVCTTDKGGTKCMKRIDDINGEAMLLGILQTYKDFLFPRIFVYLLDRVYTMVAIS